MWGNCPRWLGAIQTLHLSCARCHSYTCTASLTTNKINIDRLLMQLSSLLNHALSNTSSCLSKTAVSAFASEFLQCCIIRLLKRIKNCFRGRTPSPKIRALQHVSVGLQMWLRYLRVLTNPDLRSAPNFSERFTELAEKTINKQRKQ